MLVEFSVGNYRSFREPATLSMLAARLRSSEKSVDSSNTFEAEGLRLLRSAAIYGANASGKSNLIQAVAFMRRFVLRSSKDTQTGERIDVEPFLLCTATRNHPSYFQVIFVLNGTRYRYGFELDQQRVRAEWLYHTVHRESRLFARVDDEYDVSGVFREGRRLGERTRGNALFLSVVAQFNGQLAMAILGWFRSTLNVISGLQDAAYGGYTIGRFETDTAFRQRVLDFVRKSDLGISDIRIDTQSFDEAKIPDALRDAMEQLARTVALQSPRQSKVIQTDVSVQRVQTFHDLFDEEGNSVEETVRFDMGEQESEGTRKLFSLSGPILDTLEKGKVLIIDEMEARLHPFLTRSIVGLFNSPDTNPRNAQLIFATHDTGLLNSRFLRRDQIWFTEKDRFGATDLYSLAELQVRNDATFDKDYISGKYGAVPFVGGLAALFEERDGQEA